MKCLRAIKGVTKYDRVRNSRIREETGVEIGLGERVEQANLRWYGHVMRMDRSRYPRKVMESTVPGARVRGRPRKGWVEGVCDAIRARGQDAEEAKMYFLCVLCFMSNISHITTNLYPFGYNVRDV